MHRGRRDSVAFTVVVAVPGRCSARLVMALVDRPLGCARIAGPRGRAGRAAGRSAGRLLPVAGPLRARAASAAGAGLLWGALRRDRRRPGLPGRRRSSAAPSETRQPGGRWRRSPRRRPRAPSCCCCCGGAGTSSTASSTASSTPAWSASASRSPRTSSTSRRPTTAPTASAPAAPTALTGTFVLRCLVSPFAHPLFTVFIGIGVGIASRRAAPRCGSSRPSAGTSLAVLAARALERLDPRRAPASFFVVYGTLMLPAFLGVVVFAVYRRRSERRLLAAALDDAAERGLLPADRHPVAGRPPRPPHARAVRQATGRRAGRARRCGTTRRRPIELGFLHHRYLRGTAPDDFAARGPGARRPAPRGPPLISFPGQVVPTR